jgi:hypothetical protein
MLEDPAAYYRQIGADQERKRIIKLLEQRYSENVDHCQWGTHVFLDNAIELIKGEQE